MSVVPRVFGGRFALTVEFVLFFATVGVVEIVVAAAAAAAKQARLVDRAPSMMRSLGVLVVVLSKMSKIEVRVALSQLWLAGTRDQ